MPAFNAYLPTQIKKDKLLKANSIANIAWQSAVFIGPIVAAYALTVISIDYLFYVTVICYLITAFITINAPKDEVDKENVDFGNILTKTYQGLIDLNNKNPKKIDIGIGKVRNFQAIPCLIGKDVYIEANGRVYPCIHYHEEMGNVKEESLKDIIAKNKLINKIYSNDYSDLMEIKDKKDFPYHSNCFARNLNKTGSPFKIDEKDWELAKNIRMAAEARNKK